MSGAVAADRPGSAGRGSERRNFSGPDVSLDVGSRVAPRPSRGGSPHTRAGGRVMLKLLLATLVIGCATSRPQVPEPFVEYQRSGGIRGLDDHLVITADGVAQLRRKAVRSEIALTEDVMQGLRDALSAIEFGQLRREYLPERPGADLFEYVITYEGHAVRTRDTAIPPELRELITVLNRIIDGS